jgi:SAM-dependent methyltransferase
VLVRDYLRPLPTDRILDIGCGPASILASLPASVEYVGFDPSPRYIEAAQKRFGPRGTFVVGVATRENLPQYPPFNLALAVGVLHHLDDEAARELIELAFANLQTGGKLVTLDGCFTERQSAVARSLLRMDRGRYVRDAEHYKRLALDAFTQVELDVRTDLLRIPYTHAILTAHKGAGPE